jgi:hypothetical protein
MYAQGAEDCSAFAACLVDLVYLEFVLAVAELRLRVEASMSYTHDYRLPTPKRNQDAWLD